MVRVPAAMLDPFEAFTCFNSPYAEHDDGRAIDLYPGTRTAPSPVSGEVVQIERVRAPWRPYARMYDYVVAIDTGGGDEPITDETSHEAAIARVLHVEPTVEVGDHVEIGDPLGPLVRAGFFAPWVGNHLHVGFRPPGADLIRAGGSLPLTLDVEVTPLHWDGVGVVSQATRTFVTLSVPSVMDTSSTGWVGLSTDDGGVIDGGLPHYRYGGRIDALTGRHPDRSTRHETMLLGAPVGTTTGATIAWDDLVVRANDEAVTGLSLFCARPDRFEIKLVTAGHGYAPGDEVSVVIDADAAVTRR